MKKEITPELLLAFEEIRASMAIEGYEMSDVQIREAIEVYLSDSRAERLKELKEKADREGRAYADVVNEELGLGLNLREEV